MSILLGIVFIVLYVALGLIVKGYVLSVLWQWFIVPLGLPQISVALAIGVSMTLHLLATSPADKHERDFKEIAMQVFLGPLIVLAIGWIVKQFV